MMADNKESLDKPALEKGFEALNQQLEGYGDFVQNIGQNPSAILAGADNDDFDNLIEPFDCDILFDHDDANEEGKDKIVNMYDQQKEILDSAPEVADEIRIEDQDDMFASNKYAEDPSALRKSENEEVNQSERDYMQKGAELE